MTKIDRRDFLLRVAPLVAAPALILGSVEETEAQIKNFSLRTPTQFAEVTVGQTTQISAALIRTAYPRILRVDFKANGQIIGSSSNRPFQINWQPPQTGNFTLTAEAVLSNGGVVTSMPTVISVSPFETLYDTLGNANTGWGWAGRAGHNSIFFNSLSYAIVTCYIGTLPAAKRLRGFECAANARNPAGQSIPVSHFLGRFYLGIWRTDVGTFYQSPLGGSLTLLHANLSDPNVGSVSAPVGTTGIGNSVIYAFGWDNLDVLLPANVEIQMAFYVEGVQSGDVFGFRASSRPGPDMLRTPNGTVGEPTAARLKVSN